jgi:MFS family permease
MLLVYLSERETYLWIGAGCFTIVVFAAKPKLRPICTGIMGSAYSVGAVIGPLLGGVFTDKATWRWCKFKFPLIVPSIVFIVGLLIPIP